MIKNLLAYEGMLKQASKDGYISKEEKAMLESVSKNYKSYQESLKNALEDGLIDDVEEEELRNLRKAMWGDAREIACKDGKITDEEKSLLDILEKFVGLDDYTLEVIKSKIEKKYIMP